MDNDINNNEIANELKSLNIKGDLNDDELERIKQLLEDIENNVPISDEISANLTYLLENGELEHLLEQDEKLNKSLKNKTSNSYKPKQ